MLCTRDLARAAAGGGHGFAFPNAHDELNTVAQAERRGEVTAGFICCLYVVVAGAVIATGLLDLGGSLAVAVGAVAIVIVALELATAAWQARGYSPATSRRRKTR